MIGLTMIEKRKKNVKKLASRPLDRNTLKATRKKHTFQFKP